MVGGNDRGSYLVALILGAVVLSILVYVTGMWDIIMFLVRMLGEVLQALGI